MVDSAPNAGPKQASFRLWRFFVGAILLLGLAYDACRSAALAWMFAGSAKVAEPSLRILLADRSTGRSLCER